jgi:putative ABC transport system substrate-binding protein
MTRRSGAGRRALRAVVVCVAVAWLPVVAAAQAPARVVRIGSLVLNTTPIEEPLVGLLKARGFVEGPRFVIERRRAEGHPERLPAMAAELVRLNVDVLVAYTNAPAFAARAATSRIPIVVWAAHDAVGTGLVGSLARPGGNVTGVESLAPDLDAKRLQLLRELVPGLQRLGVLQNPTDLGTAVHLRNTREAAQAAGVSVLPVDVANRANIERALATIDTLKADALLTFTDPVTNSALDRVFEAARRQRMPTMCEFREFAQRGCLISYGATLAEFNDRVARLVERILHGAKPADLPMEQATRIELVVNQNTAREIGMRIPREFLVRADHVIE